MYRSALASVCLRIHSGFRYFAFARVGYFEVITKYIVETDLQRGDAGGICFFLLQLRQVFFPLWDIFLNSSSSSLTWLLIMPPFAANAGGLSTISLNILSAI
jgi:hypothetical protein